MLTANFSLEELTRTDRPAFQEENRILTDVQIQTLTDLAGLMEIVRGDLGAVPIAVHSGYRCQALNQAVGSSMRSQHLMAQACDFVPQGIDLADAFRTLWKNVSTGQLAVGQLIYETAERGYGPTSWIHVSLGSPWRDQHRCQQVLRMEHGTYTLLGKP